MFKLSMTKIIRLQIRITVQIPITDLGLGIQDYKSGLQICIADPDYVIRIRIILVMIG